MKFLLTIFAIFLLIFFAIFGVGNWLDFDEMKDCGNAPSGENFCEKADAIVAISGGNTNARAEKAVDLYNENFAKNIVFSGAAADPDSPSNAAEMAKIAEKNGVPKSAISLDETSRNTTENAQNVAKILKEKNWTNVILTTENYHLRRAYTEFVRADNAANFRTIAAQDQPFWWAAPSNWILIAEELGGMTKTAAKNAN